MTASMRLILLAAVLLTFTGCIPDWGYQASTPERAIQATNTPFQPQDSALPAIETMVRTGTSTPENQAIWISPAAPESLREMVLGQGSKVVEDPAAADGRLEASLYEEGEGATWFYALVAPFPTLIDEVTLDDIRESWRGGNSGPFAGIPLWMEQSTKDALTTLWGSPQDDSIHLETAQGMEAAASEAQPMWGIVPFEKLVPIWKVIRVDGQTPLGDGFEEDRYPLILTFRMDPPTIALPSSNLDVDRMTHLIMTGVTALVRSTAVRMETKGLTYPGEEVRDIFRAADLLHISNEVPFAEDCPDPYPLQATLVFCSDPSYITLLDDIGTDIVELTGNHFQDYGSEATLYTLDIYDEKGWVYFGGGRNEEDARKAALIEHNGNKLAFIGCNPVGPEFSWADPFHPGSARCDFDYMYGEIRRLKGEGYLPVVTFQHYEYYALYPTSSQVEDFRSMVEAGAVIVSGSQSHFPQYMEFYGNAYIHYGLGNLFFDQMDYPAVGTRREFADRYTFYGGRLINIELLTFMLEDYARPRVMLDWEREQFLRDVFQAAGWID